MSCCGSFPAVVSSRNFMSYGFSPVINITAEKMKTDKAEQCALWLKTKKNITVIRLALSVRALLTYY